MECTQWSIVADDFSQINRSQRYVIAGRRWLGTRSSPWLPKLAFICANLTASGNAVQTKTPTACCYSTFQRAHIRRYIVNQSWAWLQDSSMNDHERRWDTKLPQSVLVHVLHRSVETAGQNRRSLREHQCRLFSALCSQCRIKILIV